MRTTPCPAIALDVALDRLQEARERERQLREVIREQARLAEAALAELHDVLAAQDNHASHA